MTSLYTYLGPRGESAGGDAGALPSDQAEDADFDERRRDLEKIRQAAWEMKVMTLPMLFKAADGKAGLEKALDELVREGGEAVKDGARIVILSDRAMDDGPRGDAVAAGDGRGASSSGEDATAARGAGLVMETGEAREVHHHCLLIGYGAGAINPYLAFETLWELRRRGRIDCRRTDDGQAKKNYIKAANKGMIKVMSKMGISTVQSYSGAQIFEAIGLNDEVIEKSSWARRRRSTGVGLDVFAQEAIRRHEIGFPARHESKSLPVLPNGGQYRGGRTASGICSTRK